MEDQIRTVVRMIFENFDAMMVNLEHASNARIEIDFREPHSTYRIVAVMMGMENSESASEHINCLYGWEDDDHSVDRFFERFDEWKAMVAE